MDRLIAQDAIMKRVYQWADAEDALDRESIVSLFMPEQKLTLDMSSLLGVPSMEITPVQFWEQIYNSLAGFTATQHLMTNPLFTFDEENPLKMRVVVNVLAYHCIEADGKLESVTSRGKEEIDFEMHSGKWMIRAIIIKPTAPGDNPQLYQVASERVHKGDVRKGK
ncbi:hypothetical protein NA57DRAFT_72306 [Rhizodiscina lignyota]|uniref:SnoaL-like domain-containing protein n=1 Tax=Rhizodiscina lignyota TaxID=1504668 RepID=A0A9P4MAJ8_9PEZI|nr:hypothetical protein NA57DRAFT_72306 [Rhizodiscina lignyota]